MESSWKLRSLKCARIAHLDICNTSYGQKKVRESNWQFDSWPLKVRNPADFCACRWRATYRWKAHNKGYNFALDLISIGGLDTKLCLPKSWKCPLGSPGTKSHLDVGPVERHKVYYKGEGGGCPQVWAVASLVSPCCSWFVLTPKVLQLCINHFGLGLCRSVWVSEACHFFLVPSQRSSIPLYLSKVLRTRERALVPCSSVVLKKDSPLSLSRNWERVTNGLPFGKLVKYI